MEKTLSLYVIGKDSKRLDIYISESGHISRTYAQKLIKDGKVIYNDDKNPKPGTRLKEGDIIYVRIPSQQVQTGVKKQEIPLDVIYEDEHVIAINKERGMVVHPAAGHEDGTLVNALVYHVEEMEDVGEDEQRPGIVHRLDKNTSGVLIAAKTQKAHSRLVEMFNLGKVEKEYIAVVHGRPGGREGIINLPIGRDPKDRKKMAVVPGGKKAITRWKLQRSHGDYSIVKVFPSTGRTHQIRVHFSYINNPLVGDPEYASSYDPPTDIRGQALHASRLCLDHPVTGKRLELTAPIPEDMQQLIAKISTGSQRV